MVNVRPRRIALGTTLLGVVSLLTAVVLFTTIPETPPGDGFAAGLTGIFVFLYAVAGLLALVEGGLLYLVMRLWDPADWPRRLLTIGAVAGGVSVLLLIGPLLLLRLVESLFGRLIPLGNVGLGIGLLLVPIGLVCSVLGLVVQLVDSSSVRTRT
ncbi:hypothetical protein [Natrinema sp. HArc-T2]|uniref:hypothetical protein n=1 Tax=Natrinema sp. HArc-T2 TaxID=3242701 RepID=UPI00359EA2D3